MGNVKEGLKDVSDLEEGVGEINGDGSRGDGGGEHTVQCTGDVLSNCAPETCMIL